MASSPDSQPVDIRSASWPIALRAVRQCMGTCADAISALILAEQELHDLRLPPATATFRAGDTVDAYNARVRSEQAARSEAETALRSRLDQRRHEEIATRAVAMAAVEMLMARPAANLRQVRQKLESARGMGLDIQRIEPVLADLRALA